jgi:zinc protease
VTGNANLKGETIKPIEKIKSTYMRSLKSDVATPKKISVVRFPYLPPPSNVDRIISRKNVSDLDIEQIDFANGLRLNLKKTDFKRNEIKVNVAFGYGQSSEPSGSPGMSELAQAIVNESGLGQLTIDELKAALAGKESHIAFSVREENFLISGSTTSDELLLLFQLIHAHLIDPGFRESAYRLTLERFHQRHQAMIKSVDGIMSIYGERFLAGEDSRFATATYDELKKISLEQIEKWVRQGFEATPLEVSIVGDFNPEEAVKVVNQYLGGLPLKNAGRKPMDQISFPKKEFVRYTAESRIPKSLVVTAFATDDFWDINRTRRLSVLADLLSERLRVHIREDMGAAYSPYAYNQSFRAYPGYGMLRAQVTTNPSMAQEISEAVLEAAQQISKQPISADEFKRILDPTLNSIKDLRQTNRYWLNSVLTLSKRHPQQLEWSRTIEDDYRSITAEELLSLAKKYFSKDNAATVVVTPSSKNMAIEK